MESTTPSNIPAQNPEENENSKKEISSTPSTPQDQSKISQSNEPILNEEKKLEISDTMQLMHEDKVKEFETLTNEQMQKIQNEQLQVQIVGHSEPISVLLVEFEGSPNFIKKILYLQNNLGKTWIRRIRKDGSCFYRAFLFGLARNYLRGTIDFKQGKHSFENVS